MIVGYWHKEKPTEQNIGVLEIDSYIHSCAKMMEKCSGEKVILSNKWFFPHQIA